MRKLFLLCSLSLLLSQAVGQGLADSIADQYADRLTLQRSMFPQEKVHVMTDRELYQPGDTIWMRAWVVEGESFTPLSHGSRFVYAELRDAIDQQCKVVKIKEKEGRFAGYIVLPKELISGDYTLAAYTLYNLNATEHFIFKKIIHVISAEHVKSGFTVRPLLEGFKPDAPELLPDPSRPFTHYRSDTMMHVTFDAPDSTWLSIALTDDQLTPVDTTVTLAKMLPQVPDIFTPEVIQNDSSILKPLISFERSQRVYGRVMYIPKKDGYTVQLMNVTYPNLQTTESNEKGNFTFSNLDFPDGTLFFLKAFLPKRQATPYIEAGTNSLPATIHHLYSDSRHYYVKLNHEELPQTTAASDSTKLKHKQKKREKAVKKILDIKEIDDIFTRTADETRRTTSSESHFNYLNVKKLISRFKGVYFDGDVAMYKEEGRDPAPVRFVVNTTEIPLETDENGHPKPLALFDYPIEVIYAADFLNPDKANRIGHSTNLNSPLIRISMKRDDELVYDAKEHKYIKLFMPLGYERHLQFNNLRVVKQPRATRYWNPEYYTGTSGKVSLDLPIPNDPHTTYTLRVEGITPHGDLVSLIYRITK